MHLKKTYPILLAALLSVPNMRAQGVIQSFTDQTTYNAGAIVRLNVEIPETTAQLPVLLDLEATVRYAGNAETILGRISVAKNLAWENQARSTGYRTLWRIPVRAATGRYEVDLTVRDARTRRIVREMSHAASFSVHRKLVRIDRIELQKVLFTSGDPVGCRVTVRNLSGQPLQHLRLEFSDRYWPWIAGPAEQAAASIVMLQSSLNLPAGATRVIASECAARAPLVRQTVVHQYGVVIWDSGRKNVLDIAFSPMVFVRPPGNESPWPYPQQYMYPDLEAVDTSSYRHFYPPRLRSEAITFDLNHTLFPTGARATVKFSLRNPTEARWDSAMVSAHLVDPDRKEVADPVTISLDLPPGGPPLQREATFALPPGRSGIFHGRVEVHDGSGHILASQSLELAVNPLPKSVLIFCAHEDDEGGWDGLIRAAVENHIAIHFVYFTSGDAGSCDHYFEHSCGPEEALAFGGVRMEETRASLGHLGVPPENIDFLGLPDGGSGEIWYHHPEPSHPYLSVLLASDHAPYERLAQSNLPYARQPVVGEVKALIREFQPEVIVTALPPNQSHIDHLVNNYFVVKALQELVREGAVSSELALWVDRVFDAKVLPATPYHYAERVFYVSGEAASLAQEAGWFYQSQGGNHAEGRIKSFEKLPRQIPYREMLDWNEHAGWNEKP